jgi:hypothetical protein
MYMKSLRFGGWGKPLTGQVAVECIRLRTAVAKMVSYHFSHQFQEFIIVQWKSVAFTRHKNVVKIEFVHATRQQHSLS